MIYNNLSKNVTTRLRVATHKLGNTDVLEYRQRYRNDNVYRQYDDDNLEIGTLHASLQTWEISITTNKSRYNSSSPRTIAKNVTSGTSE